ncbi:MAG: Gram-negative bacterial TonB protein C-terminal [Verrucomicrobiota bacterium]|jgi:TonB family protein
MIRRAILLSFVALLLTTFRLPAPIVEEEKATPAPQEEQAKPKIKHAKKVKSEEPEAAKTATKVPEPAKPEPITGPARFAGAWTGKISQGLLGHVASTVTVDATASSVELSHNLGGGSRRAALAGDTLTWHSGMVGEISWTLTPNSDGQTAQVTMKGLFAHDTQTFRRGTAAPAAQAATTPPPRTLTGTTAQVTSAAGGSMSGPPPIYSPEARRQKLRGTGTYLLHFDTATGAVTDVTVTQSTGAALLDQAALTAFRQWHAQPNCPKEFPLTISFP